MCLSFQDHVRGFERLSDVYDVICTNSLIWLLCGPTFLDFLKLHESWASYGFVVSRDLFFGIINIHVLLLDVLVDRSRWSIALRFLNISGPCRGPILCSFVCFGIY